MIEYLLIGLLFIVITIVAVLLLSWLDKNERLARDNERIARDNVSPVEDRIEEIRQLAVTNQVDLSEMKDNLKQKYPDNEKAWFWFDQVIEYNHLLELLASSPDTTPQQVENLANEATNYLKQNKIKGVFFADSMDKLAQLVQERNSMSDDDY